MEFPAKDLSKAITTVAQALFDEAKSTLASHSLVPKKTRLGQLVEKLVAAGRFDLTDPLGSITPDVVKLLLADVVAPGSAIPVITADLLSQFLDHYCVTRPDLNGGDAPNRNRALAPSGGAAGAHVTFLYDIESLPEIHDVLTGVRLSENDKEQLFLDACDEWVAGSASLSFMSIKDPQSVANAAAGITPNLTIRCIRLDGTGKDIARSTWGQGGPTADISHYDIFIDVSEDWASDKFRAMIVHEIGHLFGLDDSPNPREVMYGYLSQPYKNQPTADDFTKFHQLGWA